MDKIKCGGCGEELPEERIASREYCSHRCRTRIYRARKEAGICNEGVCVECGGSFRSNIRNKLTCSPPCSKRRAARSNYGLRLGRRKARDRHPCTGCARFQDHPRVEGVKQCAIEAFMTCRPAAAAIYRIEAQENPA